MAAAPHAPVIHSKMGNHMNVNKKLIATLLFGLCAISTQAIAMRAECFSCTDHKACWGGFCIEYTDCVEIDCP